MRSALFSDLRRQIADLYPGYFALVMATGIVSVAAYLLEMPRIAWALLWFNLAAYAVLWVLTLSRLVGFWWRVMRDIADHAKGPGFFTVVAATCVLGAQLVVLAGAVTAGAVLWTLGLALWGILIYGFFTAITVRADKPFLAAGINGAWLIAIVATQSIAVLGTLISDVLAPWDEVLLLLSLLMFLLGCMLYIMTITLIFYRIAFFRLDPQQLTPPYWINMGAVAITTLAGATLLQAVPRWAFLGEIAPFLKGFTLLFWATGTWWIPLLLLLGAWRHLYRRVPLRYDPQYWSMVFPLGMYTASTFQLARAAELEMLLPIARGFIYVALAAWGVSFIGLVHRLATIWRAAGRRDADSATTDRPASPVMLRARCPVHGVDAEVRLTLDADGQPALLEDCSLYPGRHGDVPCEAYCITTSGTEPSPVRRVPVAGGPEERAVRP